MRVILLSFIYFQELQVRLYTYLIIQVWMFFLCVIKAECQGNRNLIAASKNMCACGLYEMTGESDWEVLQSNKNPQGTKPPPPIWKMMAFYDIVQLYIVYLWRWLTRIMEIHMWLSKNFAGVALCALQCFWALGLMFNLLLRSINLTLYLKNLFLLSSRILTVTAVLLLSYVATLYIL